MKYMGGRAQVYANTTLQIRDFMYTLDLHFIYTLDKGLEILDKGLEDPWIWVSTEGPGTNPLWILRDNCTNMKKELNLKIKRAYTREK